MQWKHHLVADVCNMVETVHKPSARAYIIAENSSSANLVVLKPL